jgi:hypothetical protein
MPSTMVYARFLAFSISGSISSLEILKLPYEAKMPGSTEYDPVFNTRLGVGS